MKITHQIANYIVNAGKAAALTAIKIPEEQIKDETERMEKQAAINEQLRSVHFKVVNNKLTVITGDGASLHVKQLPTEEHLAESLKELVGDGISYNARDVAQMTPNFGSTEQPILALSDLSMSIVSRKNKYQASRHKTDVYPDYTKMLGVAESSKENELIVFKERLMHILKCACSCDGQLLKIGLPKNPNSPMILTTLDRKAEVLEQYVLTGIVQEVQEVVKKAKKRA
jgi:hypothetical protein